MDLNKNLPKEIILLLPKGITDKLESIEFNEAIEELRIRNNKNIELIGNCSSYLLDMAITLKDINYILNLASNYSFYAQNEKIKKGFLTIENGHRIGFSGSSVIKENQIISLRNISSLNIRIAREVIGSADFVMPYIINDSKLLSSLIISPPLVGKTTLLRDIARQLSDGYMKNSYKVGIVDERGEIAAQVNGISHLNVGKRSDVLDNCPKNEGLLMLIRSMSPNVIITDEIGSNEDAFSLKMAKLSGVSIIASAHGSCLEDLTLKNSFREMINERIFDLYIFLEKVKDKRKISFIYDKSLKRII